MAGIVVAWFGSWWWMYWRPEIPGRMLYLYLYWYRVLDTYCGSRAGMLGRGSWTLPRGLGLKCSAAGVGGTHAAMDDRGGVDVHELQHRDGLFLVHVYGYTVGAGRPVDGLGKTIQTAVQLIE